MRECVPVDELKKAIDKIAMRPGDDIVEGIAGQLSCTADALLDGPGVELLKMYSKRLHQTSDKLLKYFAF